MTGGGPDRGARVADGSGGPRTFGPFTVLRALGEGGMGQVHLGRTPDGTLAAVKVIRADLAADREFRARFRQEVEMASRVSSPRTVAVLDADPYAAAPWLATEYVPAPSLREHVARHGPLPAEALRLLGAGLAEALVAIHAAGVVHRDLKPGNVLLAADGPRLIDFGIARAADATALTRTGAVIGTPGYIAPEQVEHGSAGPASDVFALGGLLLHAATGRPPFGEGGAAVVLYRVLHTDPDLRGVPPELAATVAACLQRDPARRPDPPTLAAVLSGRVPLPAPLSPAPLSPAPLSPAPLSPAPLSPAPLLRSAPTTVGTAVPRPPTPPVPARPRRRGLVAAAVVLALLLAGGLALLWAPDPGSGGTTSTGAGPTPPASPTATPTGSAPPTAEDAAARPTAEQVVRDFPTATGFTTPSGNIACLVLPDGARCDVLDKDWGDTEPGRPPDCTLEFGDALEVSGTGRGDFVCHGDTVFGSPALPYGETIRVGDAECDSRENGVECRVLSTRHGFTMSRTRYTIF